MKLTLPQFIVLMFIFGWVAGQVIKESYETCLKLGIFNAFICAYAYDAHKAMWASAVKLYKRLKS